MRLMLICLLLNFSGMGVALAQDAAESPQDYESAAWKHESELGVVIAGGNTTTRTENAKHKSEVQWAKNIVKGNGNYTHTFTEVDDTETDFEIWGFGGRYERILSEKFDLFFGNEWLGDRNAGLSFRTNTDFGGKYKIYTDDKENYLFTEFGYRFSYEEKEDGTSPALVRSHIFRSYIEWGKKWREGVTFKYWLEILPDFEDNENFQFNTEPSLSVVLTNMLSLKIAYLVKYDNVPAVAGNERVDTLYTTTLVANY